MLYLTAVGYAYMGNAAVRSIQKRRGQSTDDATKHTVVAVARCTAVLQKYAIALDNLVVTRHRDVVFARVCAEYLLYECDVTQHCLDVYVHFTGISVLL